MKKDQMVKVVIVKEFALAFLIISKAVNVLNVKLDFTIFLNVKVCAEYMYIVFVSM